MNTKILVGGFVGILLAGGGVWYMISHPVSQVAPDITAGTNKKENEPPSGNGTIADLWALQGTLECDVTSTDSTAPFTAKIYVDHGLVRSNVASPIATLGNKVVNSHMIRRDGYLYSWTDIAPQGMKILETGNKAPASQGVPTTTKISYTCKPWQVDTAVFAIPAEVSFMTPPKVQ